MKLYHGTSESRKTIFESGLQPGKDGGVYLTDNPELAIEYAISDQDRTGMASVTVVEVDTSRLDSAKLSADQDHYSGDSDDWEGSLSETDQCFYFGLIPAEDLTFIETQVMETVKKPDGMTVKVSFMDDESQVFEDLDEKPLNMASEMRSYFKDVGQRISSHLESRTYNVQKLFPYGEHREIEIIFCDPSVMSRTSCEDALGCFLVDDETGILGEEGYSERYAVMIAWDEDKIRGLIEEEGGDEISAMAWLTTITHEIEHVILFAENSNFNSPRDVDVWADRAGYAIEDFSSGYGIRPLVIDGAEIWSDTVEEAIDDMEAYVEEKGARMADIVFTGNVSPERFLEFIKQDTYPKVG